MIPFTRPSLLAGGLANVQAAIAAGTIGGDGPFGHRAEDLLEQLLGVPRALLVTSCTHALEMAGLLLDLGPGDEVIVPAFTFVSTVNAFVLRGARPVFADIRPDTLNLDEAQLSSLITARTKAIVPVHYAGVACELDAILAHGIPVVEDNAHGLFGTYRGRPLGSFGALATQSFHHTKNVTCGDPGAVVLAEILREKGTNRSRFLRGQVDKYTWVGLGSSYVLSDLLAALLVSQLEARDEIQRRRMRIWSRYAQELADWAAARDTRLPIVPGHCAHPAHMFYLLVPAARRAAFIAHLAARDICAVFHYQPLHLSPMGERYGGAPGMCPVTERVADELVRLPLFADLGDDDQSRVIDAVRTF